MAYRLKETVVPVSIDSGEFAGVEAEVVLTMALGDKFELTRMLQGRRPCPACRGTGRDRAREQAITAFVAAQKVKPTSDEAPESIECATCDGDTVVVDSEKTELGLRQFGDSVLRSWNVISLQGEPVPATGDGMMMVPMELAMAVFTAWSTAQSSPPLASSALPAPGSTPA